jgi:hypothetical protein
MYSPLRLCILYNLYIATYTRTRLYPADDNTALYMRLSSNRSVLYILYINCSSRCFSPRVGVLVFCLASGLCLQMHVQNIGYGKTILQFPLARVQSTLLSPHWLCDDHPHMPLPKIAAPKTKEKQKYSARINLYMCHAYCEVYRILFK